MKIQHFKYVKYDWNVIVYYNTNTYNKRDVSVMLNILKASNKQKREAISTLNKYNQGFTCSDFNRKLSFVSISQTTSPQQFMNTIAHEIKHIAEDICAYYGIPLEGEPSAYIIGELNMIMFDVFKDYVCEC